MPQIAKGGKYIFGWSIVRDNGIIVIPDEAAQEYHLEPDEKLLLISGSKTSGGIVVARIERIEKSRMASVLTDNPKLSGFQIEEGKVIPYKGRRFCWISYMGNGEIMLQQHTRAAYEIKTGDHLLVIRGSNVGFAMAAKGPIIETARLHPEIPVF